MSNNNLNDGPWVIEYIFLSKLYNKRLHIPTNDVVNFHCRGWFEDEKDTIYMYSIIVCSHPLARCITN